MANSDTEVVDHRRRRGRHCGRPAAGQGRHRMPGGRGAPAAGRPRLDRHRPFRLRARSRLRLAAFGRPQSVGRRSPEPRPQHRQEPAALAEAARCRSAFRWPSSRTSPRRSRHSMRGMRSGRQQRARRAGRRVARAGRPLEQADRRGRHLHQRRRARARVGARFRQLRRHQRELARASKAMARRLPRTATACRSCSTVRCCRSTTAASV